MGAGVEDGEVSGVALFCSIYEESGFQTFEVFSKGVIIGIISSHAISEDPILAII